MGILRVARVLQSYSTGLSYSWSGKIMSMWSLKSQSEILTMANTFCSILFTFQRKIFTLKWRHATGIGPAFIESFFIQLKHIRLCTHWFLICAFQRPRRASNGRPQPSILPSSSFHPRRGFRDGEGSLHLRPDKPEKSYVHFTFKTVKKFT